MNDSAGEPSFDWRALAEVYAGIAEFNNSIVARINEGGDAGSYEPYFRNLEQLVAIAADETNDVVVLETSALAADARAPTRASSAPTACPKTGWTRFWTRRWATRARCSPPPTSLTRSRPTSWGRRTRRARG